MSDDVVYQKEKPKDPEFKRKVGVNKPNGRKTRTEFEDLRVFDGQGAATELDGVALLTMDERGEWTGNFTDSGGAIWEMKLTKVRR